MYEKQEWSDVYGETPFNSTRMKHIEEGIYANSLDNVYSTDEVFTGKYWVDGKKIYRKIINNISILPPDDPDVTTAKDTIVNMDLSNIQILNISGALNGQSVFLPIPYPHNPSRENDTDFIQIFARYSSNEIILRIGVDRSIYTGYLIIEYTKTTD